MKTKYQVTMQFDSKLKRAQFDDAILRLVLHHIDGTDDQLECVYIATELVTTNMLRNQIDGFDVGTVKRRCENG